MLNDNEFNQVIDQLIADNTEFDLPQSMVDKTREIYNLVKNEKINLSRPKREHHNLVTAIFGQVFIGTKPETIIALHSDNKHMNYFDVFLEQGEAKKVMQALKKEGISTEALRGIKRNLPENLKKIGDNVYVTQVISSNDSDSLSIEEFEIIKKTEEGAEVLYAWKRDDEDIPKIEVPKILKIGRIGEIKTSKGEVLFKERLKDNRIIYRDKLGRFAKKI